MRAFMVASLALALAVVSASPGAAQVPTQDSVTGSAATGFGRGLTAFTFGVGSGPSGESPTGTVRLDTLFGVIGPLDVSCLSVSGKRARMFAEAPPNSSGVAGLVISVEDNGPGLDSINWQLAATRPGDCPVPSEVLGSTVSGDITVTDAQPLPTSKHQCKNDGWSTYGVFKNQGDCVSFVATKGKNPPAQKPG